MTITEFPSAQDGKEYHQTFQHLPVLSLSSLGPGAFGSATLLPGGKGEFN